MFHYPVPFIALTKSSIDTFLGRVAISHWVYPICFGTRIHSRSLFLVLVYLCIPHPNVYALKYTECLMGSYRLLTPYIIKKACLVPAQNFYDIAGFPDIKIIVSRKCPSGSRSYVIFNNLLIFFLMSVNPVSVTALRFFSRIMSNRRALGLTSSP